MTAFGTLPLFSSAGDEFSLDSWALSPYKELGAYEWLWREPKASFRSLARLFSQHDGSLPSSFVERHEALEVARSVHDRLSDNDLGNFGVCVYGMMSYPKRLRHADHPVQFLYYQGIWDLVFSKLVSVVGTRNPSAEGRITTRRLVQDLVEDGFTIISGLAAGIDTVAHETAINSNGNTIAVIGTPISHVYPKINETLQRKIARNHLVISQVPVLRYESRDYRWNRAFFPERNVTMAALSKATIIVEAGPTSGTRIQARAALKQGRKLFIMDHCFDNNSPNWADEFVEAGAIRVSSYEDMRQYIPQSD